MNNYKVILSNGEVVFITAKCIMPNENIIIFFEDENKKHTEQSPVAIFTSPISVVKVENIISNPTIFKNTTVV